MTGMTASEMAEKSRLKIKTVKKRLEAAGIKPITREALYENSAYEIMLNAPSRGRPKKKK
jgi:hypothetical protein